MRPARGDAIGFRGGQSRPLATPHTQAGLARSARRRKRVRGSMQDVRLQPGLLPPDWGVGPLVLTPLLYRIYSWDTVPNPVFDPVLKSSTKEWRYGMTAQLGLSDNIAANLHVIHEDTFANLPNTRIRNTQAIVGVLLAY